MLLPCPLVFYLLLNASLGIQSTLLDYPENELSFHSLIPCKSLSQIFCLSWQDSCLFHLHAHCMLVFCNHDYRNKRDWKHKIVSDHSSIAIIGATCHIDYASFIGFKSLLSLNHQRQPISFQFFIPCNSVIVSAMFVHIKSSFSNVMIYYS